MEKESLNLKNGDPCLVISGTHKGKTGTVQDLKWSKTGHITITVLQESGVRFKTLGRNVQVGVFPTEERRGPRMQDSIAK